MTDAIVYEFRAIDFRDEVLDRLGELMRNNARRLAASEGRKVVTADDMKAVLGKSLAAAAKLYGEVVSP
jgi:histone H3/H4